MEEILELKHIYYSYHTMDGETPALTDISFSMKEGEFVAVVGPSGCGNAMGRLWKQKKTAYAVFFLNRLITNIPSTTALSPPMIKNRRIPLSSPVFTAVRIFSLLLSVELPEALPFA